MSWDELKGDWRVFKGKVKQQWGKLTDDDLDQIDGKREELSGRLQRSYGYAKDRAEEEIERFARDLRTAWNDRSADRP